MYKLKNFMKDKKLKKGQIARFLTLHSQSTLTVILVRKTTRTERKKQTELKERKKKKAIKRDRKRDSKDEGGGGERKVR